MKWFSILLILILVLSFALPSKASQGEEGSSPLDTAQWAYDKDNHTLRLCVQEQVPERLRCTTFPIQVFIEGERPWQEGRYDL